MKIIVGLALVTLSLSCAHQNTPTKEDTSEVQRKSTQTQEAETWQTQVAREGAAASALFFAADFETLTKGFDVAMKSALPPAALSTARDQLTKIFGETPEVVGSGVKSTGAYRIFWRKLKAKEGGLGIEEWTYDADQKIAGFAIKPLQVAAPSPYLDYKTKTKVRLPFEVPFTVIWGGRSVDDNYHAVVSSQRFALDLLIVKAGKTFAGEASDNTSYFAFGQKVLSPGAGVVISMANDVDENIPGTLPKDPKNVLGNHVVIDHQNGEFSFLAHFKKGSVKVKIGEKVEMAQLLGLVGNTGRSTEPHIHYHLQDSASLVTGKGLPIFFIDVLRDGEIYSGVELTKGQVVNFPSAADRRAWED